MKKVGKISILIIVIILSILLISCNKEIDYTIYFDVDGINYATVTTAGSETIRMPDSPAKDGYVFDGWYWPDGKPFSINSLLYAPLSDDMTVYAKWIAETVYTLTFDSKGGSDVAVITSHSGETINEPEAPTMGGYTFIGWYIDNNIFESLYEFDLMPENNIILYAKWNRNVYEVSFNGNGGTLVSGNEKHTVEHGSGAVAPVYEKEGYTLSWDMTFDNITADITVNAIWTIKTYTVTFNGNGGTLVSGDEVQTIEHSNSAIAPVYEKEGYALSWDKDFDSITETTTVTAVWTIKTYTVTFNGNGGTLISGYEEQKIVHGSGAVAPVYEKEGYTLSWDKVFDNITAYTTVNALWSIKTYSVIFNGNGGTFLSGNEEQTIEHGNSAIAPVYEKEGYTLSWDKDFDSITKTTTVTAVWTIKTYTVTFNGNGGALISGYEEQTIEHGSGAVAPLYEIEGYNFSWDMTFENITADIIVTAIWSIKTYTVTFNSNSGILINGYEEQSIEHGSGAVAPVYEKEGYTLSWDKVFYSITADITVNAVWTIKTYTVTFNGNGGTLVSGDEVQTIEHGSGAVAPVYEKEGYNLSWDIVFDNITADIIITAVWNIKTYTVTFNGNGGILINGDEVQTIEHGSAAIAPVYGKEGYTLSWDKVFDNITADITLNAVWSIKTYTVTFNGNGGTLISGYEEQIIEHGSGAVAPVYEKEGYNLSWDTEFYNIIENANITAVWNIKTYKVTFNGNGGIMLSGNKEQTIAHGSEAVAPIYEKEGYNLSWDKVFNNITANIIVNAVWTIKTYKVTFSSNGGTLKSGEEEQIIEYENSAVAPVYEKENYALTWDNIFTNITENITVIAQWYTNGLNFSSMDGGFSVSKGSCTSENILIPEKYNGFSVTEIGVEAFSGCSSLISIIVPDGIVNIGNSAFYDCSALTSIIFSENSQLTVIGIQAFYGCSNLSLINIPSGVNGINFQSFYNCISLTSITIPNNVMYINKDAFYNCSGLTSIIIPDKVISIGDSAFKNCCNLTSVMIGNNVSSIGSYVFDNCSRMSVINIPDSISNIRDYTFYNCSDLTSITFSENSRLTDIGNFAFKDCGTLTSITIPDSVTSIGIQAFYGCNGLTEIIFGEDSRLESIEYGLLSGCSNLSSINIPNGVMNIGYSAFYGCISLSFINIPDAVTDIESYAFYNCSGLTEITFGENSRLVSLGSELFSGCSNLSSINIPNGVTSIGSYAFIKCTGLISITLPDGLTSIGNSAFEGCSSLTAVNIPDGITGIGERMFYGCSSLSSIPITNSITSIGNAAFSGCSMLTSVTIPDSVTSIGRSAFYNCGELASSIIISIAVTSIGDYTFYNCKNLTSITIGSGVTSIDNYAFYGCIGLTSIIIPDSVISIGYQVLYNCNNLISITLPFVIRNFGYLFGASGYTFNSDFVPESLKSVNITNGSSIDNWAFYDCSGLTSISIPDSVTSIGTFSFYKCTGLTSFTIPKNVTGISTYTFGGCTGLLEIAIPDGVTSIGNYAFYGCNGLTSLVIPNSVISIGDWAFYECSSLSAINIPNGVTSIGAVMFYGCSALTSISFPESVISIGTSVLRGCLSLIEITVPLWEVNNTDTPSFLKYYFGAYDWYSEVTIPCNLQSVNISNSPAAIDDYAFANFASLISISIPVSVSSIGYKSFSGCTGLTSITIPDGVTSIDMYAFFDCSSLISIIVPDSVTSIGISALEGCSGLTSITLPFVGASVSSTGRTALFGYIFGGYYIGGTSIKQYFVNDSFQVDSSQTYYIPANLVTVTITGESFMSKYGAFSGCSMLSSIIFSNTVTRIGEAVFYGCSGLTSIVIPDSVTCISSSAFYGCSGITAITIPDSVTCISSSAFYGCSGITAITIPDSVTCISSSVFSGCRGLTSITIPDSVTSIGSSAFYDCNNLLNINIPDNVISIGDNAFNNTAWFNARSGIIYAGKVAYTYKGIMPENKSITLLADTKGIACGAFWGCENLNSIILPDGIINIEDNAFIYCDGLTSIYIPSTITHIGEKAFYGCDGLSSIIVNEGNSYYRSIDNCLIEKSTSILILGCNTSIIPDIGISIGSNAFYRCSEMSSITIPDSVTSIGAYAFYKCSGLTSAIIGNGATSIGEEAFRECSELTSITIGNGVMSIERDAFAYCRKLISITIPDSVTCIENAAFIDCRELSSIIIGKGVTSINGEWGAFPGCSGLNSITVDINNTVYKSEDNCLIIMSSNTLILACKNSIIPDSVTCIGSYAFSDCTGLTSITITDSVTSISHEAFSDCTGLTSITLPDSVMSIGRNAFSGCSNLDTVYYGGSDEAAWNAITIGDSNTSLTSASRYYYSETENTDGMHWHYVDGVPTVWE